MDKPTDRGARVIAGREALDLYLRKIELNLDRLMQQTTMLETAVAELRQAQLPERDSRGRTTLDPAIPALKDGSASARTDAAVPDRRPLLQPRQAHADGVSPFPAKGKPV